MKHAYICIHIYIYIIKTYACIYVYIYLYLFVYTPPFHEFMGHFSAPPSARVPGEAASERSIFPAHRRSPGELLGVRSATVKTKGGLSLPTWFTCKLSSSKFHENKGGVHKATMVSGSSSSELMFNHSLRGLNH